MDIGRYVLHAELEDKASRNLSIDEVFSVKSVFCVLQQDQNYPFPWSIVWKACVKPRICFFTWEVAWGRILTLDQVYKRGVALANKCYLCLECKKTVDHLLLHCAKTRMLWELFFSLFGTTWVSPDSVRGTLMS